MENIINAIMIGCSCDEDAAREYLESEVDNLCDLAQLDDICYDDVETACSNLGIDYDYVEVFIERMADRGCQPRFQSAGIGMATIASLMGYEMTI